MLVPAKTDPAIKEENGNKCLIRTSSTDGGKMILTFLAEMVALYMEFAMVEVREVDFE